MNRRDLAAAAPVVALGAVLLVLPPAPEVPVPPVDAPRAAAPSGR